MHIDFSSKAPAIIKNGFHLINDLAGVFTRISDFLWSFPTENSIYKNIPILGNLSIFVIIIIITAIFLTIKFKFVQLRYFTKSIHIYQKNRKSGSGHYSDAFILSLGARIGMTNIVGVTTAIAVGGAGAMFWIWVCGIFSMCLAFVEATLTQIFKEKKDKIFYGGLPFYGQKLFGNNKIVGAFLAIAYIAYAYCSIPIQGYTTVSAIGCASEILLNAPLPFQAYIFICICITLATGLMVFGSIYRVKRANKVLVPIMLTLYVFVFVFLVAFNFDKIPSVFYLIFKEAFDLKAWASGTTGYIMSIGLVTAITSNEAGIGTISFADATSNCSQPVRQGLVASLNVFIDTIIVCTMTGILVIMSGFYREDNFKTLFESMSEIDIFAKSIEKLTIPVFTNTVLWIIYLCLALFSFTTLICYISFCDLSIMKVTRSHTVRNTICTIGLFITIFGVIASLLGLSLDNVWALSNLSTVIMTLLNIPLLIIGSKYVRMAFTHYQKHKNTPFNSTAIGSDIPLKYWDRKEELDEKD